MARIFVDVGEFHELIKKTEQKTQFNKADKGTLKKLELLCCSFPKNQGLKILLKMCNGGGTN